VVLKAFEQWLNSIGAKTEKMPAQIWRK